MMDYAVPRAAWFPNLELDQTVTPSPVNPLGVKGVGEAGAIATTAAVANAVIDALSPLGIQPSRHAVHVPDRLAGDPGREGRRHERRRRGPHQRHERLEREGRPGMIPAAFEYTRPASLDEADRSPLGSGGQVIAGGQSILPLLKLRLANADRLIDIGRIAGAQGRTGQLPGRRR